MQSQSQEILLDTCLQRDLQFNQLYPVEVRSLSAKHWTPLQVAYKASNFLAADKNTTVLDIGSGAGKFCLAAAYYKPNAFFLRY